MRRDLPHLRGTSPDRLAARFAPDGLGLAAARRVVARLVGSDRDDLDGVRDLPRTARRALETHARRERLSVSRRDVSPIDGFAKYLFVASDGARFEAVRIPLDAPRWSACVSSQAGCAMGCDFCATGRLGLARHLEAWEIVEQVLTIRREAPERPLTGVVFQGQGEPLHAYDSVMDAIDVLAHPSGGRLSADRMTISTVGPLDALERYVAENRPVRLLLSLHSAFQDVRSELVPTARHWPVGDLARLLRARARQRSEPVHLAWTLISGWNTTPAEARELRRLFPDERIRLSLIDVNDASGRLAPPDETERNRFIDALAAQGIAFHRRYSGGADVAAACGMLASCASTSSSRASMLASRASMLASRASSRASRASG